MKTYLVIWFDNSNEYQRQTFDTIQGVKAWALINRLHVSTFWKCPGTFALSRFDRKPLNAWERKMVDLPIIDKNWWQKFVDWCKIDRLK